MSPKIGRSYVLSKLGEAIVEALPDRELVKKIELHYKRTGRVLRTKKISKHMYNKQEQQP
jgi:hypothetical protein